MSRAFKWYVTRPCFGEKFFSFMTSLFGSVKYTCGPKKNWQHIFLKSLGDACSEKVITLLVIRVAHDI